MTKKLLKSLSAVVLAMAGILAFSQSANAAVKGDVNGDGVCNSADVTALYKFILNNDASTIVNGDQNADGTINSADVTAVYQLILNPAQFDKVYILGEVNGNQWDPTVGVEMTTEDGNIYTAQVSTKPSGFSYFSFTKKLAQENNESAWDEIAPYRFGALGEGVENNFVVTEDVLGTSIALTNDNFIALQVAPGNFNLSIDMEKMELTITGEFAPQPQPETNWYIIGTINEWSTTDKTYKMTQDAENANVYNIRIDGISRDFWFKIANENCYTAADFWNEGSLLAFPADGVQALSGNLVQGNQGAFCLPGYLNATYIDITINTEELTYTITTDGQEPEDDPDAEYEYLYITGDADGWNGNGGKVASIKGENDYYGFVNVGTVFKFQKIQGEWGINWGGSNGTLVSNGANIEASGYVYVNANLNNMTYSVTPITSMGVIGDATQGGWETETPLTYNAETNTWEGTITFTDGEFKFRGNNNWDISFGGTLNKLVLNSDVNIHVEAGTYNVALKLVCPGEYSATLTPAN